MKRSDVRYYAIVGAITFVILALAARVMSYPLQHDEQFYVPAGILFSYHGLYKDLGFTHFPNLPILLTATYRVLGIDHYLLAGRIIVLLSWLVACAALILIGRDYARSKLVTALMVALLVFNMSLLDATGMAVTNNLAPIAFALLGLHAFLKAIQRPDHNQFWAAIAGFLLAVAAGFKANYTLAMLPLAIAALLLPILTKTPGAFRRLTMPMLIGGIIGGAPTIAFFLTDPASFFTHVYSLHRGPQIEYWLANPDPAGSKIISLRGKMVLANTVWFSGANLVLLIGIALLAILAGQQATSPRHILGVVRLPVILAASVMIMAMLGSLAPTPAFPQYYTLFVPFGIVLFGLLHGTLDTHHRAMARPYVATALAVTIFVGAPALLTSLPKLLSPGNWTGVRVHKDARQIADLVRRSGNAGPIATLAPVHALEGKMALYPYFTLGPFIHRVVPWMSEEQRAHFKYLAAPANVPVLLNRIPPSAVLVGFEDELDRPFEAWAIGAGYRRQDLKLGATDGKTARLYLAPTRPELPAVTPRPAP